MDSNKLTEINEFFSKTIQPKEFTKSMRRLQHVLFIHTLDAEENEHKVWISDGYFWLKEFVEILDPMLTEEE